MLSMGKKSGEFVARGLWPSRLMVASNSLNLATNLTAVWSKHLFSKVLYSDLLLCRFRVNGCCVQIIDKYNFVYTILCDSFSWVIAHVYIRNGNMLHHHFINKISVSIVDPWGCWDNQVRSSRHRCRYLYGVTAKKRSLLSMPGFIECSVVGKKLGSWWLSRQKSTWVRCPIQRAQILLFKILPPILSPWAYTWNRCHLVWFLRNPALKTWGFAGLDLCCGCD